MYPAIMALFSSCSQEEAYRHIYAYLYPKLFCSIFNLSPVLLLHCWQLFSLQLIKLIDIIAMSANQQYSVVLVQEVDFSFSHTFSTAVTLDIVFCTKTYPCLVLVIVLVIVFIL